MSTRRKAREMALQVLYQLESTGEGVDRALSDFASSFELSERAKDFAWQLARGVLERRAEIDAHIEAVTLNWSIVRVSRIDLCVIRIAVFELLHNEEVAVEIILDEAIEIARKFGTADSAKFVNGILDPIAKRTRAGQRDAVLQPGDVDRHESET